MPECSMGERGDHNMTEEERKIWIRVYQRQHRREAKCIGLCSICYKRAPKPGCLTCEVCIQRARDYQRRRTDANPK